MPDKDMILNGDIAPSFEGICSYINEPYKSFWQNINDFIQLKYKSSPKITYSTCSGKPGWNVKYQKSGKSLCTLYPEKDGFVALIVVLTDMVPAIEAMTGELDIYVVDMVKRVKPFNGTLWLMIQVSSVSILESAKQLMLLKHEFVKK